MRLRCLLGLHEWVHSGRVAPPPEWNTAPQPDWIEMEDGRGRTVHERWRGFPVFALKRCVHCPASSYDMVFPDGTRA